MLYDTALMSSPRRFNVTRMIFWVAVLYAFVMAVIPHPPEIPGVSNDKVQHIIAFLVLGTLASFAYSAVRPAYLGAGLSLFGALIEVIQLIPALHRDGDPVDWVADTAAAGLVIILLHYLRSRSTREVDRHG